MSDIHSLVKMLQSNNPNIRYDACEQLRVSPSLPLEALKALRLVTNDGNPDVADAARRALAMHPHASRSPVNSLPSNKINSIHIVTIKTSALENFITKIDGIKLNKTAEEYYKDGGAYLAKKQFDDAILEFIKAIRKSSTLKNKGYLSAQAALISMGFSKEDIKQVRLSPTARRAAALKIQTELAEETIDDPQPNVNWFLIKVSSGAIISLIVTAIAAVIFEGGCTNLNYIGNLFFIFMVSWISWVATSSLWKDKESSSHFDGILISFLVILVGAFPCIILNMVSLIGVCT